MIQRHISFAQSNKLFQVFCLIGTNDNKLNYQAAEASIRIAEESRRIAEDSKNVAILTRRDSTGMRVIAAVTPMFLPGTFVAVSWIISWYIIRSLTFPDILQHQLP